MLKIVPNMPKIMPQICLLFSDYAGRSKLVCLITPQDATHSDWLKHTPILIFAQFLLYPLYFEQVLKTKYML